MINKEEKNPYSSTVILPNTDFPMKADLSKRELTQIQDWKKNKTFQKMKDLRRGKKAFVLHDGPPYANGNFHVGHALNKILKDIIVKSKTLSGHYTDFIPGWDCHGLPIEVQVLKNLDKKARDTSPNELRKLCREYAEKYIHEQGNDLDRFLCFWDSDHIYLTMSKDFESKIVEIFGELYIKGYVYRGKKPVYWCIQLATAHAEAEIEYKEHTSPSIYVKFPIIGEEDLYCLIWTTTPWTIPANLAISFNPTFEYSIFQTENNEKIIIATALKENVEKITGNNLKWIKKINIDFLKKSKFQHPFLDKISIPLFGDHVTLDAGTGCVHTAPGHGSDDYKIGLENGLEPYSPVDNYGKYTDEFPLMKGVNVFDANPKIVDLLKEKDLLFFDTKITHSYPHSWRSKKPLIFRATPQWFFKIDHNNLRNDSLNAIEQVHWIPSWGISRIKSMVETRPDWCLSRQRNWGVPIPSFHCKKCNHNLINEKTIRHFTDLVKNEGIEIWYTKDSKQLLPVDSKCENCGSIDFEKENDILDVWFDSGVSSFAVFDNSDKKNPPADLYLEGSDQHRGWFQSSLWPSMALRGFPPYKAVLTHGFILDSEGRAMSKSLGNVISPTKDITSVFGADVLRLWVSSQDFKDDVKIGDDSLRAVSDQYRKIRNTFRYLLGNLNKHDKKNNLQFSELDSIDAYYLSKFSKLLNELKIHYENYEFHQIYQKVSLFCNVDLSQGFFEIIRDRMYCEKVNSPLRKSSLTVLDLILDGLCIYTSPILSFTAEEVWKERYKNQTDSVFFYDFLNINFSIDDKKESIFSEIFECKEKILKALEIVRQEGKIGKSLEASIWLDEIYKNKLKDFPLEKLEEIFVVSQVHFKEPNGTLQKDFSNNTEIFKIYKPSSEKCVRCWRQTNDYISEKKLCERCEDAIKVLKF